MRVIAPLAWLPTLVWLPTLLPLESPAAQESPTPPTQHVGEPAGLVPGWVEYNTGLEQLGAFALDQAAASFAAASKRAPQNIDYATAHALALLLQQKFAEGRAVIDRACAGTNQPPRLARAIRAFAAALNGDRAGMLTYPPPQTDFEWFISRLGESLASKNPQFRKPVGDAVREFQKIAADFAQLQTQDLGGDKALLARGLQHRRSRNYAAAIADLAEYVGRHPDDWVARWNYAAALTGGTNYARARRELSLVLCEQPALFEGYCQRAIAAARMNNFTRAREDLAIARKLDPRNREWLTSVEKVIAENQAVMPRESPERLLNLLLNAAREGESDEELAKAATKLVRAANAERRHGDETYQDRLRRLQWAALADPKDPAKLAALGQFLCDELEVRGEYVDPGRNTMPYRVQTLAMRKKELELARGCFQRALQLDSSHVPSLMGMAQIKFDENLFADAEKYVRSALAVKRDDPVILDMMSRLMKVAAEQQLARAMSAASTYSWDEPMGNGWVRRWTRYGDAVAAGRFENSAMGLLEQANEYLRRALAAARDTPESLDFIGTRAVMQGDFELMRKSYERAVQKVPDKIEYRYALANAYASLGNYDKYLEQATAGRNLEQTSCAAHLLAAWQAILGSDWKRADAMLTAAQRIDPADSRIPAYRGAIAEAQGNLSEAAAYFRAALAVEEAHVALRGSMLGPGSPGCLFDEVARAVVLRMRLARVIEEENPSAALELYEKNLAIEPRLLAPEVVALSAHEEGRNRSETEQLRMKNHPMLKATLDALLPEPRLPADAQKTPPNAAGLLQTNRRLAAVALYRLNRRQEAADYFRLAENYANHLPRGGIGSAYVGLTGLWTPRPVDQIAEQCFRELGQPYRGRGRGSGGAIPNPSPSRRPMRLLRR